MDIPAPLGLLQPVESLHDDPPLELAVEGHAEVMPHHEGHEHRSRRLHMLGHIPRDADGNRGDTPSLDCALHERDRLVSDWSGRGE